MGSDNDRLGPYRRKRDFDRTSGPLPGADVGEENS